MRALFTFVFAFVALTTFAQPEVASRRRNFNTVNFVAMREFDPVSYFQGKPVKGSSQFEVNHKGIYYYFANEANREEFKKSPGKYEPAYGGFCAYTVAKTGERVKILPTAYKIINGKLHLFYFFNNENRLDEWERGDEKKLKAAADKNWVNKMH
jgi:YHS domain-containing protein